MKQQPPSHRRETTMPERHIDEATAILDQGVDELAKLVAEVKGLQRDKRRYKVILSLVAAVLVASISTFGYVLYQLEQNRVSGCRERNSSFTALFDFIELQVDNDQGQQFVDGMRTAAVVDCDRDGGKDDDINGDS